MQERKSYVSSVLSVRSDGTQQQKVLEGYFIKFNTETQIWRDYYEMIDPSSIGELRNVDIRALFNHDSSLVLGRTGNGTLSLEVDAIGLKGSIIINEDDPQAVGVYARVQRGDVTGCSFGFIPVEIETINRADGTVLEIVKQLQLLEVSPCTFPAYPQTEIEARQQHLAKREKEALENKKQALKEKYDYE